MRKFLIALLLVAFSGTAACAAAQLHTMSGAFATCAKGDLGQVLPTGLPLLTDVAQAIDGNAVNLEADLTSLAVLVGTDAVKCAVAAVAAVLAPPPAPSGAKAAGAPRPGLVRAEAWVAAH